MNKEKLLDLAISTLIIVGFIAAYIWVQIKDAQEEVAEDKQVCIITHQTLNRNESQEVCGKLASL